MRRRLVSRWIAYLLALSSLGTALQADPSRLRAGDRIRAVQVVVLRSKSPVPPYYKKGVEVGRLRLGDHAQILEVRRLATLSGQQIWLFIEYHSSGGPARAWAYAGQGGKSSAFEKQE
jgi:hypothetical protein